MTLPHLLSCRPAYEAFARAARPGVVLDFDGTLAEMGPEPERNTIHPAAYAALQRIADADVFPLVAVLSGRAVLALQPKVGIDRFVYAGNHGAEYLADGEYQVAPGAVADPDSVTAIVAHLKRAVDLPGVYYEDKGFSASVHFRDAARPDIVERLLLATLRSAPDMAAFDSFLGRKMLEVRPRRCVTKGDALASMVDRYRLDALLFVGDDVTDADGMRRMPSLPLAVSLAVAVLTAESPPALRAAADYAVSSVAEVARLLVLVNESRKRSNAWHGRLT